MKEVKVPDTIDEVLENPHDFGLPTFDEFAKNPDKYLGRDDDSLASVEGAGYALKPYLKKVLFEIEGYRCKSLHEVEKIAKCQGIPLRELDYVAVTVPQSSYSCDVLVKFMKASEVRKRYEAQRQARFKEIKRY